MKHFGIGILIFLIALLLSAGCTQSSPAPIQQPVATAATLLPTPVVTPMSAATTSAPQVTVTVIHYIVPTKVWKDAELHITFTAPQDWEVMTQRMSMPEGSQGLMYKTELVPNDVFSVVTYPISLNQDQTYRNTFRGWNPAPVESTVTYNGITFDRFESTKDGMTHVGYVAQKASASDIGFSSVIVFTADAAHPFEKEDFDTVVASFVYLTKDNAATMPGEEIPRVR
ncbi:MAG: hypothetical protein CVV30_06365 [Methanomicrobiales archaeon HGW-Methanomicrobiales-1]|jgi:hypothetical protein|nr:MAG: hypothetical protein CVV30_06365 [Methanomicrobiales archaeon HGW-Methanomicrobiales-1]